MDRGDHELTARNVFAELAVEGVERVARAVEIDLHEWPLQHVLFEHAALQRHVEVIHADQVGERRVAMDLQVINLGHRVLQK